LGVTAVRASTTVIPAERRAHVLAAFQAADLVLTQFSPKYGDEHLDHLGVPARLRPLLPVINGAAVTALVAGAGRSTARSIVGASLVAYYSAAVSFHVRAGDPPSAVAPAAACALLAATLV
jgi:hypothetical protein